MGRKKLGDRGAKPSRVARACEEGGAAGAPILAQSGLELEHMPRGLAASKGIREHAPIAAATRNTGQPSCGPPRHPGHFQRTALQERGLRTCQLAVPAPAPWACPLDCPGEDPRRRNAWVKRVCSGTGRLTGKVRTGFSQNPVTRKEAAAKINPMGGLGGNNNK